MEISDHGYRFVTYHNEVGDLAQVDGHYERFQEQAPIRPHQPFTLDFYGRGSTIELLVATPPRRATPQQRATLQRAGLGRASELSGSVAAGPIAATGISVTHHADALPSTEAVRREAVSRANSAKTAASAWPPADSSGATARVAFEVGPAFHSPFDIDWLEGWGLDPLPFPPIDPGGGGGGGGKFHTAVRLELFVLGQSQPFATWELPEGIFANQRSVRYEPQGFPTADAPVRQTTWFRMVATPVGLDPVDIYVGANVRIADVPIRTTTLGVRLTNHLFRVGLEVLLPNAQIYRGRAEASISPELTALLGTEPVFFSEDISPFSSQAKLRSLRITSISGAAMRPLLLEKYRERAAKVPMLGHNADQKAAILFKPQIERLALVQPGDVCIRIEAAFCKALLSVWGLDLAKLEGNVGELFISFDPRMRAIRPFAFFDVDYSALVDIAVGLLDIFVSVPTNVNKLIENALIDSPEAILKYLRAFLARAVGASNVVYECRFANDSWQIRNSADPVIPPPGRRLPASPEAGPLHDGGIIEILALAGALGNSPTLTAEDVAVAAPRSAPEAAPAARSTSARELPEGFLPNAEQLARLDRHQCIVVVMMENRSYDHMLGDLMHLRPDPEDPYDGAPFGGASNAGAGGLHGGVPLVRASDLRIGTAIPVSPRHYFDPVQFQIGDGTDAGRGTGDMQGFARDLAHKSDSPQLAMTVYGEAELPVHYDLADRFCTCERWFAAHPGPTFPNRFATIMGRIPELDNFELDDPRIGYIKDRSIFDALSGARIEWRLFESDLSLIRMFDRFRLDSTNVVPINDADVGLEATLRRPGPLPRVMFVEPNFADIPPVTTADDDHPPADLAHGQKFLARVCDLIWDTNRFDEVLLVITYDEHGGFYDHVPPPGTVRGEQRSFAKLHPDGPTYLGVRVPTFVISPYVKAGAKNRTVLDHTSILKTILVHNRDRLSNEVLQSFGPRVAEMPDLSVVLELDEARPAPVPFVRRRPDSGLSPTFGAVADLGVLADLTATLGTTGTGSVSATAITPREVVFSERTTPPVTGFEPREFHGALYNLMRPRKL